MASDGEGCGSLRDRSIPRPSPTGGEVEWVTEIEPQGGRVSSAGPARSRPVPRPRTNLIWCHAVMGLREAWRADVIRRQPSLDDRDAREGLGH